MKWMTAILALAIFSEKSSASDFPIFVRHGQVERIPILGQDPEAQIRPGVICAVSSTSSGSMAILTFAKCVDFRPERPEAAASGVSCKECGYITPLGEAMPIAVEAWGSGAWSAVAIGVRHGLPTKIPSGVPIRCRTLGIGISNSSGAVTLNVPPGVIESSTDLKTWTRERYSTEAYSIPAIRGRFYRMKY